VYVRVVAAVSGIVFATAAVLAAIVTDLHDRTFPSALDIRSRATLDFSRGGWSDTEAFSRLAQQARDGSLVLYKVAPDLGGDEEAQVFVSVRPLDGGPRTIPRFGAQADSRVEGPAALRHSFASGEYVTGGDRDAVAAFRSWATDHRLVAGWSDDDFGATLAIVWRQSDFAVSVSAAVAVMVSVVLFWLAVRARGRALRVVAGAPTWRIQWEDLGLLTASMLGGALVCSAAGAVAVGLSQGWTFVPLYATCLGAFAGLILAISTGFALVMSMASWPRAQLLVGRRPAVTPLRKIAGLVKATTFVLVVASVGPAVGAYLDSSAAARQQATWKALADQVSVAFPATHGDALFTRSASRFRQVVSEAETADAASLSYSIASDTGAGVTLGPERNLVLVNQRWLDLVAGQRHGTAGAGGSFGLEPVDPAALGREVRAYLDASLAVWLRRDDGPVQNLQKFRFYRWSGPDQLPTVTGGASGDLAFLDTALVMVVRGSAQAFSDDFLVSAASTSNLVFTGVTATESLLAKHGLGTSLFVKLVAEEGVLRAQYTAYFAWLRGLTVLGMVVALALATVIGAVISALTNARKDFAVRVSGASWWSALRGRLAIEWAGGALLAAGVMVLMPQHSLLVVAAALTALLLLPCAHVAAARWSFQRVVARAL